MKSILLVCAIIAVAVIIFGVVAPFLVSMPGDVPVLVGVMLIPFSIAVIAVMVRALVRRAPTDIRNFLTNG